MNRIALLLIAVVLMVAAAIECRGDSGPGKCDIEFSTKVNRSGVWRCLPRDNPYGPLEWKKIP